MAAQAYLGVWLDQSSTPPAWTLTLPERWGSLLTTALALLVTFAGAAFWTIISFSIHQCRADRRTHDTLYYQTQVLLANPSSPAGISWKLAQLWWAWKKSSLHNTFWRIMAIAFWPLAILISFSAASIFVGRIASPATSAANILLTPTHCGVVSASADAGMMNSFQFSAKVANDSIASSTYVDSCYHSAPGMIGCNAFPVQSINYTTKTTGVDCPFGGAQRCLTPPISFKSDPMHSNHDLGIDKKKTEAVTFALARTCSVLHLRDLTTLLTNDRTNVTASFFNIGPIEGVSNYTYSYFDSTASSSIAYTLQSVYHVAGVRSANAWDPIRDFNVSNADVSVHFLAPNSISYLRPVYDPLFSANGTNTRMDNGTTYYEADQFVNGIACLDQYQFCDASNNETCTTWGGLEQAQLAIPRAGFSNKAQEATALRLTLTSFGASSYNVVAGLNGAALQASKLVVDFFAPGLPSNQWQIETARWFETSLAIVQGTTADFVTNAWAARGGGAPLFVKAPDQLGPNGDILKDQCDHQRVRSTDMYRNFAFAGVLVVVVVSPALVIISWTLEKCVASCGKRKRGKNGASDEANRHKYVASVADANLNLMRVVLERDGIDGWDEESAKEKVPWLSRGADQQYFGPKEDEHAIGYRRRDEEAGGLAGDASNANLLEVGTGRGGQRPQEMAMLGGDGVGAPDAGLSPHVQDVGEGSSRGSSSMRR